MIRNFKRLSNFVYGWFFPTLFSLSTYDPYTINFWTIGRITQSYQPYLISTYHYDKLWITKLVLYCPWLTIINIITSSCYPITFYIFCFVPIFIHHTTTLIWSWRGYTKIICILHFSKPQTTFKDEMCSHTHSQTVRILYLPIRHMKSSLVFS